VIFFVFSALFAVDSSRFHHKERKEHRESSDLV
jgi:hypothetical protein